MNTPTTYDINRIIAAAGGIEALAAALKLHPRRGYNVVSTWKFRGAIPPRAILENQALFDNLMKKADRAAAKAQ